MKLQPTKPKPSINWHVINDLCSTALTFFVLFFFFFKCLALHWKTNKSENNVYIFFFIYLQIQNAAEEPRALCIIQDITSAKTVNERLTLNLPASTTLSKLYEDVAHKAGYVNGTFGLAWGNTQDMVSNSSV